MSTCGTCKYQGERLTRLNYETYEDDPTNYFICQRAKMIEESKDRVPGLKVFVIDGSGYYAALCVETDFGCNQWEAK